MLLEPHMVQLVIVTQFPLNLLLSIVRLSEVPRRKQISSEHRIHYIKKIGFPAPIWTNDDGNWPIEYHFAAVQEAANVFDCDFFDQHRLI
ncbi:hypothetical protein LH128_16041 [Sphingomonas sp. LH128]|nr:hypothetical protein LH128_16041 [Sphingomonas sp. LH128]